MKPPQLWIGLIILALTLQACNLQLVESPQGGEDASLLQTITAQALILEQAGQTATPLVAAAPNQVIVYITATADGAASATLEAVIPAAVLPPATGPVTVTVSVATNCRQGPGTAFASVYGMPVGQVAKVVAKNSYSGYWIIEIPGKSGQTCWLWGQYATINGDTTSLKDVVTPTSVATLKPTATNTPIVTATSTTAAGPAAVAGCTDSNASNYNSAATVDDGSCIYTAQATILGCTDPSADNYNSSANSDDGSCTYIGPTITNSSVVCEDQLDGNYNFIISIDWVQYNKSYARKTIATLNGAWVFSSGHNTGKSTSHYGLTKIFPAGTVVSVQLESNYNIALVTFTCP